MKLYHRYGSVMGIQVIGNDDDGYRAKCTLTPAGSEATYEMKELLVKGATEEEVLLRLGVWAGINGWKVPKRPQ